MEPRRVLFIFEYLGTRYAGWQRQTNALAIQQVIEEALEKITQAPATLIASGRTDAGVHALALPAHADLATRIADSELVRALNALLPEDIVAREARTVSNNFHARYSALEKTYRYLILNRAIPSAFDHGRVWHFRSPLDVEAMRAAAQRLPGERDFSSFRSAGCASKQPVRDLSRLTVERQGDFIVITFTGSGFLKQMARNITGTLVDVGRGALNPDDMTRILAAKDRSAAGPCAPAEGLTLVEVTYPQPTS
ncbi:MAG: tRNA pseudouridine(38-40) synthase TruA [Nitrospinae bacterium]|nr:tRNA pseudouridine(38-40) synthase TruA [Nitrospinota bacterium]